MTKLNNHCENLFQASMTSPFPHLNSITLQLYIHLIKQLEDPPYISSYHGDKTLSITSK